LVAVLLAAALSLQFVSVERAGGRPVPDRPDHLGSLGERLNANTIAIVPGNPNAADTRAAEGWLRQNPDTSRPAAASRATADLLPASQRTHGAGGMEESGRLFREFVDSGLTNADGETKTLFL
jgi:hypothetical protein